MGQSRKNLLTKSKMKASSQDMIFWGLLLAATVLVFARPKSEKCCGMPA
jgi:hypothetical protein